MKTKLETVTLLGIDCVDIDRLVLASSICQKDFEFADVKLLTSLPAAEHENIVRIDPINSVEDYSKFVIARLAEYVESAHVLIIQHDGFILNPSAWTNDFLQYDYVGAPWLVTKPYVKNFGFPEKLLGQMVVGNGGFSLRSKKLLTLLSDMYKNNEIDQCHPEDVAICVVLREQLESRGIQFAPHEVAQQFSYEALDEDGEYTWCDQFGFHGLHWTDISKWLSEHPEYDFDNTQNRDRTK